MTLKDIRQQRGEIIEKMKLLNEKAIGEKRSMAAEETTEWDKWEEDQEKLKEQIERLEKQEKLDAEMRATVDPTNMPDGKKKKGEKRDVPYVASDEYRAAFNSYLEGDGKPDNAEIRALQADLDVQGGYLVAPQQFANELIKFIDDLVFIRGLSTVIPVTSADSLGALISALSGFPSP